MPFRVLHRLWIWGPPLLYMVLIFYLSSLSSVPWAAAYPDYVAHSAEYLGLAVLVARALNDGLARPISPRLLGLAFLLCLGYAASDEIHQMFVPNRFADYRDVLSDVAGAALALMALHLVQGRRRRGRDLVDGPSREVVLYSRPGCPLCFALRRSASRAARRASVPLRVVDVSREPALLERYGNEVPVLELPGGRIIQGYAAPLELEAAFREAAGLRGGSDPVAPTIAGGGRRGLRWFRRT